jgi:1-acyl-sn-glycerol-3-phosphate acyltransferase
MRHQAAAWLFAVYAWSVLAATAPFVWLAVVLMPRATWSWFAAHSAARLLGLATRTTPTVHGLEHIPRRGRCVLVANHASYLDSFVLMAVVPRAASFVAKRELERNFFVRVFLRRLRTQFVSRFDKQKGVAEARRIAAGDHGEWPLLYYPEGRLTRPAGVLPFHMGAFLTAAEKQLPVVPIALKGTRSMLRPGTRFPRRTALTVTVGSPVGVQMDTSRDAEERDAWPAALELRDASRKHILQHCGEPESNE